MHPNHPRAREKSSKFRNLKKIGDFSLSVLSMIGDGMEMVEATRSHQRIAIAGGLEGVRRFKAAQEATRIRERVQHLKRRKLIEEKRVGGRLVFSLTERGKAYAFQHALRSAKPREDAWKTYVLFDIPEHEKHTRDFLRGFLKSVGFKKLQMSVWTSDRDVSRILSRWVNENGFSRWLSVLLAREI